MRRRRILLLAGGGVLVAWCGWVSGFHRSSTQAESTWIASLAAVVAIAVLFWLGRRGSAFGWNIGTATDPWPRPDRGGGRLALRGIAAWLGVIVLAVAWDVLGIDTGPHEYHLTISALSEAYRPLNALLLLLWMLVGIGYAAARARMPLKAGGRSHARMTRSAGTGKVAPPCVLRVRRQVRVMRSTPALLLPSNRPLGVAFWIVLLLVAVAVEALARRSAGRVATAEEFARFISTPTLANIALIAAWAFAGYHLFAR